MSARRNWPRSPVEIGERAWFYIGPSGLEIYIEQSHETYKPASVTIPWRSILSALDWWRRLRGKVKT